MKPKPNTNTTDTDLDTDVTFSSSHGLCMNSTDSPYGQESIGCALDVIIVKPDDFFDSPKGNPDASTTRTEELVGEGGCTGCMKGTTAQQDEKQEDIPQKKEEEQRVPQSFYPRQQAKGIIASSDFSVQFPEYYINTSTSSNPNNSPYYSIRLQINGTLLDEAFLSMSLPLDQNRTTSGNSNKEKKKSSSSMMCTFVQGNSSKPPTEVLSQLVQQGLIVPGRNLMRYILVENRPPSPSSPPSKKEGTEQNNNNSKKKGIPIGTAEAHLYLWDVHDTIIISDIDGTVTKSDVRGVIDSIVTETYGHVHDGVCAFFSDLVSRSQEDPIHNHCDDHLHCNSNGNGNGISNGGTTEHQTQHNPNDPIPSSQKGNVRILYLSSRPLRLITSTRKFITNLEQESERGEITDGLNEIPHPPTQQDNLPILQTRAQTQTQTQKRQVKLPPGPIFLHTGTLAKVLLTELVKKSTHEFKADVLARQVVIPFIAAGKQAMSTLFLAGFGNKGTDAMAYEMVGIRKEDIYIINRKSLLVSTVEDDGSVSVIDNGETTSAVNDRDGEEDVFLDDSSITNDVIIHGCCALLDPISGLELEEEYTTKNDKYNTLHPINILVTSPASTRKGLLHRPKKKGSKTEMISFEGYKDPQLKRIMIQKVRDASSF